MEIVEPAAVATVDPAADSAVGIPAIKERPRPCALQPPQQVLGRFSIQDRGLLSRILSEPIEFVDHPSFVESTTAVSLFGESANRAPSPQPWCNAAEIDPANMKVPSEAIILSAAEEQRLFLQLNYARFRVAE